MSDPAAAPQTDSRTSALLLVGLLAVGALSWRLALRPELEVHADALATLPLRLAPWTAQEIPLEDTVERILRADFNLQRTYTNPIGDRVWLYVGYYGTARGGRSEHSPFVCYPSAGWTVVDGAALTVAVGDGHRANEIVVERAGNRRLVHFWYQSSRRTGLVTPFGHAVDRMLGRLLTARGDGAFIRVSTPLDDGARGPTRDKLLVFGSRIDSLLAERWPREIPRDA